MAGSTVLLARRALVKLLVRLAVAYHVLLSINRDDSETKVTAAFRKIVLKVHPDKGGRLVDAQETRKHTNKAQAQNNTQRQGTQTKPKHNKQNSDKKTSKQSP